jgi:hypothetical protein
MMSSDVVSHLLEKLFIACVGQFPDQNRNTNPLGGVNAFIRFVWISPVRGTSTASAIPFLTSTFATSLVPDVRVSDNAAQFTPGNFRNLCFVRGTLHGTGPHIVPSLGVLTGLRENFMPPLLHSTVRIIPAGRKNWAAYNSL